MKVDVVRHNTFFSSCSPVRNRAMVISWVAKDANKIGTMLIKLAKIKKKNHKITYKNSLIFSKRAQEARSFHLNSGFSKHFSNCPGLFRSSSSKPIFTDSFL